LRSFTCILDFLATLQPKFPCCSFTIGSNLGLHYRDRLRTSGLPRWLRGPPLCSASRLLQPPDRSRAARLPTPPEVCRPSGGVIAGVRSTRDYHPRHLPPLVFLKPSTACSSRRLTCSVSHRHHLWDSKNTTRWIAFLVFLTGPSEDSPVRDYEARNDHLRKDGDHGIVVARCSTQCSNEAFVSHCCQRVTHPIFCKQSVKEEGTPTSS